MAENTDDIFDQFKEFLAAKAVSDAEESSAEDYEVEVFDERGRGARLRRSHAKPFLQSLGIDLDPDPGPETDTDGIKGKKPIKPKTSTGSQSISRKYFAKKVTGQ